MRQLSPLLAALALAGCGGTPELTVEQAAGREGEAVVSGLLHVDREGEARLCAALAESFPPQCGQPSLGVEGLTEAQLAALDEGAGVRWSAGTVELAGDLRDGVLVLSP